MAYSALVRERALSLYLMGENPERIAEVLSPEHPNLSANTIRRWASDEDDRGQTWDQLRKMVDEKAVQRAATHVMDTRSRIMMQMRTTVDLAHENLLKSLRKTEVKTPEQMMFALASYYKVMMQLDDEERARWTPAQAVHMLFDAMSRIPDIKTAVDANWHLLRDEVAQIVDTTTRTVTVEAQTE